MCEHKPEELRRRRQAQEPDPALMRALLHNCHFTHWWGLHLIPVILGMSFLILFFFTLIPQELLSNPTDILRFTVWGLSGDAHLCFDLQQRRPPPGSQVSAAQFSCLVPKLRRWEDSAFLQFNRYESNYLPNCFNRFEVCTVADVPVVFLNSSPAGSFPLTKLCHLAVLLHEQLALLEMWNWILFHSVLILT